MSFWRGFKANDNYNIVSHLVEFHSENFCIFTFKSAMNKKYNI